jgi:hypothetical protein
MMREKGRKGKGEKEVAMAVKETRYGFIYL